MLQLRSLADPTVLADAADLWSGRSTAPELFGPRAKVDTLLTLRRAARAWPPVGRLLDSAAPAGLELSDEEAQSLLGDAGRATGFTGSRGRSRPGWFADGSGSLPPWRTGPLATGSGWS